MPEVTMKELLEAGVHFGHQTRKWNPKMAPYIYGRRNGIHIIDLQKTAEDFKRALDFLKEVVANGGEVLFVGTKKQAKEIIKEEATRCGMPYVNNRWLGGTLTNFEMIRRSVEKLIELEEMRNSSEWEILSKKEQSRLEKRLKKLQKNLEGIKEMVELPKAIFVIDSVHEEIPIKEARKLGIPIVAVVDTNADPDLVDYPIAGNDDAIRAIKLFCSKAADAIIEGREERERRELEQMKIKNEVEEIPEEEKGEENTETPLEKEETQGGENG